MDNTTFIYALIDPVTGFLRYVGKADKPAHRLTGHLFHAKRGELTRKARWIKGLLYQGLLPEMFILEAVPIEGWQEAERFWIAYLRAIGCPLVNHCAGGRGNVGLDAEARQRISLRLRGKTAPAGTAERIRARNTNPDFWTPAVRRAASEAQRRRFQKTEHPSRGKTRPAHVRQAVAEANARRTPTDDTRAKLSEAARRRNQVYGLPDNRKTYIVTAPDGTLFEVLGLRPFCREHGLDSGTMNKIANGKSRAATHKGWACRLA